MIPRAYHGAVPGLRGDWEVNHMLITGPEGFRPVQKKTVLRAGRMGAGRSQVPDACYDHCTLSAAGEAEGRGFREEVAALSRQVRTHNTTGKIQELRRAVSSGEYQIAPRETAARMLLMEEGE